MASRQPARSAALTGLPAPRRHPAELLPYLLHRANSRVSQAWRGAIRPQGLTDARWQVLAVLQVFDGSRIGTIADLIGAEQPAVSRVIDQMVRDRLVRKRRVSGDQRSVEVWLQPAGRRLHARLLPVATRYVDCLVAGFAPAEIDTMMTLLGRLLDNVPAARDQACQ